MKWLRGPNLARGQFGDRALKACVLVMSIGLDYNDFFGFGFDPDCKLFQKFRFRTRF